MSDDLKMMWFILIMLYKVLSKDSAENKVYR